MYMYMYIFIDLYIYIYIYMESNGIIHTCINMIYRNTSLLRHRPYKWGCLISEAHRSTFQAISPDEISVQLRWMDKKNGKTTNFHCANSWNLESVRNRYIFIFEWGASPNRTVPYRWGITVVILNIIHYMQRFYVISILEYGTG